MLEEWMAHIIRKLKDKFTNLKCHYLLIHKSFQILGVLTQNTIDKRETKRMEKNAGCQMYLNLF